MVFEFQAFFTDQPGMALDDHSLKTPDKLGDTHM